MKLTLKQRRALAHALIELESNPIDNPDRDGGHYYGNRAHFIKNHIDAKREIIKMLEKQNNGTT
jgi:hypothetical protein